MRLANRLTLVKGDEGVEAGEEGADRALLRQRWHGDNAIEQLRNHQLRHKCPAFRAVDINASEDRVNGKELLPERYADLIPRGERPKSGGHNPCSDVVDNELAVGMTFCPVALESKIALAKDLVKGQRFGGSAVATGIPDHCRHGDGSVHPEFKPIVLFITLSVQLPQLTLFPSGGIIVTAFVLHSYDSRVMDMPYADMVERGAGETELRSYLVDGDIVPITVRIPSHLRDSAKEEASLRGMSFSAFVRACVISELTKGCKND